MSLRQVRRLRELSRVPETSPTFSEESEDEIVHTKRSVFANLQASSSESSSSEDEEPARPAVVAPVIALSKPKKKKTSAPRAEKLANKKSSEEQVKKNIDSVIDPTIVLDIKYLNPSNELRRIFGRQVTGPQRRQVVSKRRHWLIQPADRTWPLSVKDCFRMELCRDGSHRLVPENEYESKLKILVRIVASHDIEALYQFIQFNPFHVHGLCQLALILIEQRKEFENAYELIKRALYSLQSCFLPSFHPDKSLVLSKDSMFTSTVFRCLMLYAHLLAGQGCLRTSLEVWKLIYLMEGGMATACPVTHALLHLDSAAFRSEQYELVSAYTSSNNITEILPGTALVFAIAQKLRNIDLDASEWNAIQSSELKKSVSPTTPATVALIRCTLMFPSVIKAVLGRDISDLIPGGQSNDILINKLVQAFTIKTLPSIKTKDAIMSWINQVLDIVNLKRFKTLKPITPPWLSAAYSNIVSSEFEWGSQAASFVETAPILESESQIMEMYLEDAPLRPATASGPGLSHAVSLDSNPVAAFLQTLLPWSRVDTSGTESTPITARGLMDRLFGPREPSDSETDQDQTEDEEEIVME